MKIQVETKYNIGDNVYYPGAQTVNVGIVKRIEIIIEEGDPEIRYEIPVGEHQWISMQEHHLYGDFESAAKEMIDKLHA